MDSKSDGARGEVIIFSARVEPIITKTSEGTDRFEVVGLGVRVEAGDD